MKAKKRKLPLREQLQREEGAIIKNWGGRLPIALIYPNSYYLGMSNLGFHAIYSLFNSYNNIVCERAFLDIEQNKKQPVLSMESQRPLSDFPILAFSISYELDYFNIAPILKSRGIPLYAADRDESHPLIIAGGPCVTANPAPLAPFFDCLCIGEAEPIIPNMLPVLTENIGDERQNLLKTLSSLPGIYIPRHHDGNSIARQWAKNLDDFPVTSAVLTPDTELGDLYLIEVERGCNWGCRFCLVHNTFSPMRFRSLDKLIEQAEEGLKYRRRIGLVGPAVTDHPQIEELLAGLRLMGAQFSISSLRINRLSDQIVKEIARGGIRTIVLAPEAGSQRLRQVIRKGISEDNVIAAVERVAMHRIKQLKLYFMVGLPTETDEDIEEIINLTLKCKDILDRQQSGTRLALNIAPFVPKAGTPFQWLPMAPVQTLNQRLSLLKNTLIPKGIQIKSESPAWSQVQGVLSRGDARLAGVLANTEKLSLAGWRQAMKECHLDTDFYAHQRWDTTRQLPWSMIDSGAKTEHLQRELNRALA